MGTVVRKDHPGADVRLDYYGGTSGTYAGFDRFGRVTNQLWEDYSAGAGNEVDILNIDHGYDRASNRLYAQRNVYTSASAVYTYDDLHRLSTYKAGLIKSDQSDIEARWTLHSRTWNLDQLGNHADLDERGDSDYFKNTVADGGTNEYTQRQVRGDKMLPKAIEDLFDSTSASNAYWELPAGSTDAFDIHSTSYGKLSFTTINQDTYDSKQEPVAAIVVLYKGPNVGSMGLFTRYVNVTGAQVGLVFGYQSMNDYWICVYDKDADEKRIYHIFDSDSNGSIEKVLIDNTGSSSDKWLDFHGLSRTLFNVASLADGYPSGRIGVYSTATTGLLDFMASFDDESRDLMGTWTSYATDFHATAGNGQVYADVNPATDRLEFQAGRLKGGRNNRRSPVLLRGTRVGGAGSGDWRMTFSVKREQSWPYVNVVFNATGRDDLDNVRMELWAAPKYGVEYDRGVRRNVSYSRWNSNFPSTSTGDTVWYRVIADDSAGKITIHAQKSVTKPSEGSWDSTNRVYESTDFDLTGGMVGFVAGGHDYMCSVDDLTLEADRDNNGSFETTEHVEDFTIDASGYADISPEYDLAGNLTFDGVYKYTYDAWNRLIKVQKAYENSGIQTGSTIMQAEYDGQGRRIVKQVQNSGDLDCTYNYYYRGQSAIEIRNGSDQVLKQQVWGLTYIDELVEVGLNDDPADGTEDDVESFYYAMQDANFNVMGMVDSSGVLTERYEYTPYGKRTVYISPGPNDPDAYAPTTRSNRWQVSSVDQPYGLNEAGHQGLMHDDESGLIYNRARMHHPRLGRFIQRDPLGYVDGMSLYQSLRSSPLHWSDPSGTEVIARCREGLDFIEQQGLTPDDFEWENIGIDASGIAMARFWIEVEKLQRSGGSDKKSITEQMLRSPRSFSILDGTADNWSVHIKARSETVKIAKTRSNGLGFAPDVESWSAYYWLSNGRGDVVPYYYGPGSGELWYSLLTIKMWPKSYSLGCQTAAFAWMLNGIGSAVDRSEFNSAAGGSQTSFDGAVAALIVYGTTSDALKDWIAGDMGLIHNPRPSHGSVGDENVIYVGGDNFYGHPYGVHSLSWFLNTVRSWDNAEPEVLPDRWYPKAGLEGWGGTGNP